MFFMSLFASEINMQIFFLWYPRVKLTCQCVSLRNKGFPIIIPLFLVFPGYDDHRRNLSFLACEMSPSISVVSKNYPLRKNVGS